MQRWTVTVIVALGAGALLASDSMPRTPKTSARACQTETLEGVVGDVNPQMSMFYLNSKKLGKKEIHVTKDTRFRVPGVRKQALKEDPLIKLPTDAIAKIKVCKGGSQALEVKVQKDS